MVVLTEPICPECGRHYDWIDAQAGHCVTCWDKAREEERKNMRDVVSHQFDTHTGEGE